MNQSEWYAIDLHTHTSYGYTRKKGKEKKANINFSYLSFIKAIKKYDIKLISTTNHNWIDMTNFVLIKYLCKKCNCNALMGVELDNDLSSGKPIHIVCIFLDIFEDNFKAYLAINNKTTEKLNDTSLNELFYTDNEIIKLLKNFDFIMVPHGDKVKGMLENVTPEQAEEVFKKVREGFIHIFDSPSNWRLEEIKDYLSSLHEDDLNIFGGVLFSDNKDWEKYKFKSFYMNAEPTYRGIIHSSTNPVMRFKPKQNIELNHNYISRIQFIPLNQANKITSKEINLSRGYNCIIGKSGTGKSLLLYIIKKHFSKTNVDKNYSFIENTQIKFYNENDEEINQNDINISVGENLFDRIIKASTIDTSDSYYDVVRLLSPTFKQQEKFNKFKEEYYNKIIKYYQFTINIKDKQKEINELLVNYFSNISLLKELKEIKTFSVKEVVSKNTYKYSIENLTEFEKYEENIKSLTDTLNIYKGQYKDKILEQIENLKKYFKIANKEMYKNNSEINLYEKKLEIINSSIRKINGNKSKKAEQKSKLISNIPKIKETIVILILDVYLLKLRKNKMDLSINIDDINSTKKISKNIIVNEYLDKEYLKNINEKNNEIFNTHGVKSFLEDIKYNLLKKEYANNLIERYINVGLINENKSLFYDNFVPKVDVLFNNQDIRKLNPGTIAKEYLHLYFDEQVNSGKYNVILFDQIENDVDKEFISKEVINFIESTKGKLQLIIVTHDPIVAVNADPNKYIVCVKNQKGICYRDFVAESSISNELNTIAKTVDGSENIIKRRYEIYKGENL